MLKQTDVNMEKHIKSLERAKHRLLASIAIHVDPILREAAMFLYNMVASTSSASMEVGDLLSKVRECTELCQHLRKELEWHDSQHDANYGDTPGPVSDDHLNWLLQKRNSRRISQFMQDKHLVAEDTDPSIPGGSRHTEAKDTPAMSTTPQQPVVMKQKFANETTPEASRDRRHVTLIKVGNTPSIGAEHPEANNMFYMKIPGKTDDPIETPSKDKLSWDIKVVDSSWSKENESVGSPTKEMPPEAVREICKDRKVALGKGNIISLTKEEKSAVAQADPGTSDLRDDIILVALRNKEMSQLREENPSATSVGERNSVTLREVSSRKNNIFRALNLHEDSNSAIPRDKQISRLREENPSGTSFGERNSVVFEEVSLHRNKNISRVPDSRENSHSAILRDNRASLLREENPSGISVGEKNSVIFREVPSRKNNIFRVPNLYEDSNSAILEDKQISRLREENPSGTSFGETNSGIFREVSLRRNNIFRVPVSRENAHSAVLRDKKTSRLREENPSGTSIGERDFAICKEVSSSLTIECSSGESNLPDGAHLAILRNTETSRLREENPSGTSIDEENFTIFREVSSMTAEYPSGLSNLHDGVLFAVLRNKKTSHLREENPSGTSIDDKDFAIFREVSSMTTEYHSGLSNLHDGSLFAVLRDKKTSHLREENPSGTSIDDKDFAMFREVSSMTTEYPSGLSNLHDGAQLAVLRDKDTSRLREENPSGTSIELKKEDPTEKQIEVKKKKNSSDC